MKKRAKKAKRASKRAAKVPPKPLHLTINVHGPGPVDIGGGLPIDTLTIGKSLGLTPPIATSPQWASSAAKVEPYNDNEDGPEFVFVKVRAIERRPNETYYTLGGSHVFRRVPVEDLRKRCKPLYGNPGDREIFSKGYLACLRELGISP